DTVLATGSTGEGWQATSWESVAGFVLAGGAAGGAVVTGTILAGSTMGAFTAAGVALLLLPILLGAFLTVLVVLFIFAARQAIITILVIISPLALVAYLLPNTEKWFEKWRGLFTTMLVFFPAFSLVFGGAQFAGLMIITAAVSQEDINMLLLGMAVQIAPLAITPLLLRLSGSLLSKIGGIINDPSRGLKDRTKNWAKDRQAANKAGQDVKTREMAKNGTLRRRSFVRHAALGTDTRRRIREGNKSNNETRATALFDSTDAGYTLSRNQHRTSQMKESIDSELKTKLQMEINAEGSVLHADRIEVDAKKSMLKNEEGLTERMMSEYRTEKYLNSVDENGVNQTGKPYNAATLQNIRAMKGFEDNLAVDAMATQGAKRISESEFSKRMETSEALRTQAGGIEGERGRSRALASAYSTVRSTQEEAVKNAGAIISHGNYDDSFVVSLAKKDEVATGMRISEDLQIAAIRQIGGGKNADALSDLIRDMPDIPNLSEDVRQEFGGVLKTNSAKPVHMSAGYAAQIESGDMKLAGNDRQDMLVLAAIQDGKYSSAENIVNQDKRYLRDAAESLDRNKDITTSVAFKTLIKGKSADEESAFIAKYYKELNKMTHTIHELKHDSRYEGRVGNKDQNLGLLYEQAASLNTVNAPYKKYEDAVANAPVKKPS
ncbi:MAG: hypothetical protein ABIR91_00535, partial [Candidatus Saccharimonadales bacterium]